MEDLERLTHALSDRYSIEREIGSGGMATVYLAQDLKHNRQVAVKVLNPDLAVTLGAERFLLEIATAANLTHPHILPLHDSGETDGYLFYVMPYVEGESLRERLNRETQLPVDDAVRITQEVADGLSYAHNQGVIHRDIKPENILLSDGHALIVDFGIARAVTVAGGARLTETGLSLGTPHYMSPEQASGELEVDARSDVYALGCVTYEMLAGEPPHTGPNVHAIIAKVLTQPVRSLREMRKTVPLCLEHAVGEALARLPADRWATAQQYAEALTEPRWSTSRQPVSQLETEQPLAAKAAWRAVRRWVVLGAVVLVGIAAGLGWLIGRRTSDIPVPAEVTSFTVPARGGLPGGQAHRLAVSPNGRVLAYTGNDGLMIWRLDREDPLLVPETTGAITPIFSPDGMRIGFARGGTFHQVQVADGSPAGIASIDGAILRYGATWLDDSTIIYVGNDVQLWEIPAHGGESSRVTAFADSTREIGHVWPQAFADGRLLVFTVLGPSGLWYDASVVVQNIRTGERTAIAEKATFGRYLSTGHIVYATSSGMLHAVPFDPSREEVTGPPFPVEAGVRVSYWGGAAHYAISETGTFAFIQGSDWENHLLVWLDRNGHRTGQVGSPVTSESTQLSPDGQRIALYLAQPGNADIYVIDAESGERQRITFDASVEDWPVWSPDSRRLAYQSAKSGLDHRIEIQEIGGVTGPATLLSDSPTWLWPTSWSPDGRWLAFTWPQADRPPDIYAIQVDDPDCIVPVAVTSSSEHGAQFSPDGHWLAYQSDETGRTELYVVSFPEIEGKQQISSDGGSTLQWSQAGDELFFWKGTSLMSARVSMTGGVFRAEPAQPMFEVADMAGRFSVAPDGERFLVKVHNPESSADEINIVLNWFEVLKEKAGR